MIVLGISAYYHDSAACLLKDGEVLFAAQEERFTRKKHDSSFPKRSVEEAFKFANISIEDVDIVAFYEKPFLKFERIIDTYAANSPKGFLSFRRAMKSWFSKKLWIGELMKKELGYKGEVLFTEHHEAHAASAFYASPFEESAVLTIDGVGEKGTALIAHGKGNELNLLEEQHFPHSLGLFYSAMTYYCGFKVNSGEYKLMGLAPYGKPIHVELLKQHFIKINDDGSIELNRKLFNYEVGDYMLSKKGLAVLGRPVRKPDDDMSEWYFDMAASAQKITEEAVMISARRALDVTGSKNLCLAGGVALNCKANGELEQANLTEGIWVQPASGDSGGALGAALAVWYKHLKNERVPEMDTLQKHAYLGSQYSKEEVKNELEKYNVSFIEYDPAVVAKRLSEKAVVGWFHGRMEYGPRALGNRSILASPIFEDMKSFVNQKIKMREGFRPFAPMVKAESASDWFEVEKSKYMLFTHRSERAKDIPSCIHEDGTARVQTVDASENELIHELLSRVEDETKTPVLINTSFNVRGEPIVESPLDALRCLFQTGMDLLVIEGFVVSKNDNPVVDEELTKHQNFELD